MIVFPMFFFKYNIGKGVIMKNLIFLVLLIAIALTVTNCERKGTITDISRIKQAEKAILHVRNALEEYYIQHNTYPPQGVDLREVLAPYMPKTMLAGGDSISRWEKEIVPAFSEGSLTYTTQDPELSYFVKVRANDINKTLVSIRPSIIRKKEEENDKNKGK
jgi:hypothetical protein